MREEEGGSHSVSGELFIRGVDTSQTYHSLFRVIEALDELHRSALPGSARTNKGCGLS